MCGLDLWSPPPRAIRAAWPAFVIAWAARGLLEAVLPILRIAHVLDLGPGVNPAQFGL